MGIRDNFQKLINKKLEEIEALELQARETRVYVQALQDSMKLLPRDATATPEYTLREGSALSKIRDILRNSAQPMSIGEILKALGKPQDKKHRTSLAGTLSAYSRDGKIFAKTAPNTFGLLEFQNSNLKVDDDANLPEEFGSMEKGVSS